MLNLTVKVIIKYNFLNFTVIESSILHDKKLWVLYVQFHFKRNQIPIREIRDPLQSNYTFNIKISELKHILHVK